MGFGEVIFFILLRHLDAIVLWFGSAVVHLVPTHCTAICIVGGSDVARDVKYQFC